MSQSDAAPPTKRKYIKKVIPPEIVLGQPLVTSASLQQKWPSFTHSLYPYNNGTATQSLFYLPLATEMFDQDMTVFKYARLITAVCASATHLYIRSSPDPVMIIKTHRTYESKNCSFVQRLFKQADMQPPCENTMRVCRNLYQSKGTRGAFFTNTPLGEQTAEPMSFLYHNCTVLYLKIDTPAEKLVEQYDRLVCQPSFGKNSVPQRLRAENDTALFAFFTDTLLRMFTDVLKTNCFKDAFATANAYCIPGETADGVLLRISSDMDIKSMILSSVYSYGQRVLDGFLQTGMISSRMRDWMQESLSKATFVQMMLSNLDIPIQNVYANVQATLTQIRPDRVTYNPNLIQKLFHKRHCFLQSNFKFLDLDELSRTAVINLFILSRMLYKFMLGNMVGNNGSTFFLFGNCGTGKTSVYESLKQFLNCYQVNLQNSKGWFMKGINGADVLGFDELEPDHLVDPVNKQMLAYDTVFEAAIKHTDHLMIGANSIRFCTSNHNPDDLCQSAVFFQNLHPGQVTVFQAILRRLCSMNLVLTSQNHCHLSAGSVPTPTNDLANSTVGTLILLGHVLEGKRVKQPYHPICFADLVDDPNVYAQMYTDLENKLYAQPGSFILKRMAKLFDGNPALLEQLQAHLDGFQANVYTSQNANIEFHSKSTYDFSVHSPHPVAVTRKKLIKELNQLVFGAILPVLPHVENLVNDEFGTDDCLDRVNPISRRLTILGKFTGLKQMLIDAPSEEKISNYVMQALQHDSQSPREIAFYIGYMARYSKYQRLAHQFDEVILACDENEPVPAQTGVGFEVPSIAEISREEAGSFAGELEEQKFIPNSGIEVFPERRELSIISDPLNELSIFNPVLTDETKYLDIPSLIRKYDNDDSSFFGKLQSPAKRMRYE